MKIVIIQDGTHVSMKMLLNKVPFQEDYNFSDSKHACGMFADTFHKLTGNRYKEPTESLIVAELKQLEGKAWGADKFERIATECKKPVEVGKNGRLVKYCALPIGHKGRCKLIEQIETKKEPSNG